MSNTMTAHEPLNYLDSILSEEERRCDYGHQWRNFTISRSGRFKSKNKKRDVVDGKLFDAATTSNKQEKYTAYHPPTSSKTKYVPPVPPVTSSHSREKDHAKGESYKSLYETNL